MKKIFILLLFFVLIAFGAKLVFSDSYPSCTPDGLCSCSSEEPHLDPDTGFCIGEKKLSSQETKNVENLLRIVENFNSIKNNTIPNFDYLSQDLKDVLISKFDEYYQANYEISTTTLEISTSRSERDYFFQQSYVPYLGLSDAINFFSRYNKLGYSIQNLIELLNTTEAYIETSSVDVAEFLVEIRNTRDQLEDYIVLVNSDIAALSALVNDFDSSNIASFSNFIDSSIENRAILNSRIDEYLPVKYSIISTAIQAIQAVEAAYNGNSSISASPTQIYPEIYGSGNISVITVTVQDSLKNPITSRLVTLTTLDSANISPSSIETDENGVASFEVSSNVLGKKSFEATIEGEELVISGSYLIDVVKTPAQIGCEADGGTWSGTTCSCPKDFTWDGVYYHCFDPDAKAGCEATGGSWYAPTPTCKCKEGFTWYDKVLKCIDDNAKAGCEATGGAWKDGTCICGEKLPLWDELKFECVAAAGGDPEGNCTGDGGKWTGKTCICQPEFFWDADPTDPHCIERASDPAGACIADGGTWDGKTCKCPETLPKWDEEKFMCIK